MKAHKWMVVVLAVVLALGALAACQEQPEEVIREVTRVVTETVEVEGEQVEVTRVVTEEEVVEVTRVVETEPEPVEEPVAEDVDRQGGWLDTIVIVEEPDANAAVARLEAGDLDVYADDIAGEPALQAIESEDIETRTQYGLFDELMFNLGVCQDENQLNPFQSQPIREAMNYAIDRDYVAQELYNGLAVPKYAPIAEASADRARFAKEIREIEAEYAYDLEQAQEIITSEMEAMGAEMVDGVWTYNGEPVTLIFLIRNEDTRLQIGNYIANQLEEMGFQVERVERTSSELSPIWASEDPTLCNWHLYTGAWSQTSVDRESTFSFEQYYTTRVLPWPPIAIYDPPEALDEAALQIFSKDFSSLEERAEIFRTALPLAMEYATRDWITSRTTVVPFRNEVDVTTDLAAGISGSSLWAKTIRFEDQVGGSMTIGLPSVFTEPWNPWGGSNWVFDQMVIRGVGDLGINFNPYTGLGIPGRVERVEMVVEEGYPMNSDWVELSFEPEVVVPDDAWAGWDAENQVFLTAADVYTETQTALLKSTVYYPEGMSENLTWHDGSPVTAADFVMGMITTFDLANPDSPYYEEALAPGLEQFLASFKGVRIASTDPLVIEHWTDAGSLDAENAVVTWWPGSGAAYPYADAAWHNMGLMLRGTEAASFAFTDEEATANEVDRINMIAGPSLDVFETELAAAQEEGFIPYEPTLSEFVSADDVAARYENLAEFARRYGHYYISTGPYFLSGVFPVEGQAVLTQNANYPDQADRFAGFSVPLFPEVEIDGPARVTIGEEAVFDLFVEVAGEPYPAEDISSITYLVYDANGELAAEGTAEAVEDGLWEVVLGPDVTGEMPEGSSRLDIVAVSELVAIPRLVSFEFVTAP